MSDGKTSPAVPSSLMDPVKLSANLAKMFEQAALFARQFSERPDMGREEAETQILPMTQIAKTLGQITQAHLAEPQKLMEAQQRLWMQYTQIWTNAWAAAIGQTAEPVITAPKNDKRFKDPDWAEHTIYDALKQVYLVTGLWAREMVRSANGIDEHTRHKASFYVENLLNAISPSNFPMTNPEVVRATLASNGENLLRGLRKLQEDWNTPDGRLRIKQVDSSGFKLGENLATTPGKVVYRNDIFELIQYSPQVARTHEIPLLIVPPWINKYYILDLNAKKSFVKYCVENGLTVFIMSWANAAEQTSRKSFSDYMRNGVIEAMDVVKQATGSESVNLTGFCIGGSLVASTMGYLAAKGDGRINSATFLTTQVDFEKAGDLLVYVDQEQIDWIEGRMAEKGYLPGSRMADAFNLLRSNDLIWSYVVNNYLLGKDPMAFDLLHWNSDSTRMPAGVHSFYLRECYLHNRLGKGQLVLDNMRIDLTKSNVPIYNLACRDDHIAPLPSVFKVGAHFGGETTLVVSGSGHIAGVVNPPAANKYQYWTNDRGAATVEDWMKTATEHPGSWWPHWLSWITAQSGGMVTAPVPETGLADAPGEYVRVSGVN